MAHHPSIKLKALELRTQQQLTIDEIAARLALPRTTIYHWVRAVPIERTSKQTEAQRRATARMQKRCAATREAAYATGLAEFDELSREPTFRDFVCMYVGEGYKRSRNQVALANSDPAVIVLANRWIRRFQRNPVRYRVQYHADQDLRELQLFWSRLVGVEAGAIVVQRKSNSGGLEGRTWRSRHGVLTVGTSDTLLRARLGGWMDALRTAWA